MRLWMSECMQSVKKKERTTIAERNTMMGSRRGRANLERHMRTDNNEKADALDLLDRLIRRSTLI